MNAVQTDCKCSLIIQVSSAYLITVILLREEVHVILFVEIENKSDDRQQPWGVTVLVVIGFWHDSIHVGVFSLHSIYSLFPWILIRNSIRKNPHIRLEYYIKNAQKN